MNAVTGREDVRVLNAAGDEGTALVEPLSNYFTGRVRREIGGGRTVVGGLLTPTHRDVAEGRIEPLLHGSAYLAGLDFEHRWSNRQWVLSGILAGSHVSGSESALAHTQRASSLYFTRPDAEHLTFDPERTALQGTMAHVALQRSGD
jgi:hypothetical protein